MILFWVIMIAAGCGGLKESGDSKSADAESAEAGPVFSFVDAMGNEYQAELNEDIERNLYNDSFFTRSGSYLSYEEPLYTSRNGIDVSQYQGEIDWEKVAAAGYEFAFLRLGFRGYGEDGSLNVDETFVQNITNAQAAGIDVGVYFFAQAVNEEEAVEEAEFVLEQLEGYSLELPVVYDPETISGDEDARTDNVTGEQFTKNTIAFCERIEEAGFESMVYANMLWEAFELDLTELEDIPIWYADYEDTPQTPYYFEFWQYSEEGTVDGIDGAVDLDIQIIAK